jgi:hypothetical protein
MWNPSPDMLKLSLSNIAQQTLAQVSNLSP